MARLAVGVVLGVMLGMVSPGPGAPGAARAAEEAPETLSPYSARADCIVLHESHWDAGAVNPRSGAAGLGQFLRSTWATTPYAARSVFDAYANHAAVCWMLAVGRAREFDVVRLGLC